MNPNPQYGPWVYYPTVGYFTRNCNYYDNNQQNHFAMIYHPSYPQFYYCYYPTSWNTGYYWCRCYSPNAPEFNSTPFYFSVIPDAATHQYPTIEAANAGNPSFGQFSQIPATYPPSGQVSMQPLPPGLPQG